MCLRWIPDIMAAIRVSNPTRTEIVGPGNSDGMSSYVNHIARTAEAMGWAWAYWQFDSDFIVYDIDKDRWVEPILKALIP